MANRRIPFPNLGSMPTNASVLSSPIHSPLSEIAFKIPKSTLEFLISTVNPIFTLAANEFIVGIQFEFKTAILPQDEGGEITWEENTCLQVSQVTYNPDLVGTDDNPFRKLASPIDNPFENNALAFNYIKNEQSFIVNNQPGKEIWYTLSEDVSTESFEKLEFYSPDIVLVYFTANQIRPLVDHFEYVSLSGCQIGFGKKLNRIPYSRRRSLQGDLQFTLKMEALGEDVSNNAGDTDASTTVAPDIVLGHRCPPDWYIFKRIIEDVYSGSTADQRLKILNNYDKLKKNIISIVVSTVPFNNIQYT